MKIIKKHKNTVSIKILNKDDLWYLSQILEPGDLLKGKTLRKIKIGDDTDRSKRIVKKTIFIEIQLEKIEFSKTTNALRASGVITQGPDDVAKGSHHTFTLDEQTQCSITKNTWLKFQLERLKQASTQQDAKVLLVAFDREEAYFALMQNYGYKFLSQIKGKVAKKDEREKPEGNFYREIIKQIESYKERYKSNQIILASPAFWREYLLKELDSDDLRKTIIPATCSSASKNAFSEILKRDEVKQALKNERAAQEINLVESLLAKIGKQGPATYGQKHVYMAADAGAVKTLLLTDEFLFTKRDNNTYEALEVVMKNVESMKGEIHIISSDHEGGKKLNGLSGIGAILRYQMQF
ncbi:MAG: mRNA surveillance protein pelota [Candidatus Woesearchaeota archaeon]|nr:mRNA surveillance protein pelota [Candidatus Woesearchaeota archaeon]MDP7323967.1 mRNA surveillance protein pelota [Candidatus Woesearchaeota archaeon]MDP7457518.1 mRNA surveillance protein pelota [Candidatus Woesearchaeota archaeon]